MPSKTGEAKKLTAKQERFCQEYIIDLNATQAARRAGYSERSAQQTAAENMLKPVIAERIAELQKPIVEKAGIDAEFVIERLIELNDICMGKKSIEQEGENGEVLYGKVFEHSGASKSLELLGRHLALFTDNHKVSAEGINYTFNLGDNSAE